MKTPYDVLGVPSDADDETIRAAFRKAAKVYHPDVNAGDRAAEQHFKRIIAAHAILKNPDRRAAYDHHLRLRQQQARREWRVTIAGCIVSALMSAGVVGGGVFALRNSLTPERSAVLAQATVPAPSFEDRFAAGIIGGSLTDGQSTAAEVNVAHETEVRRGSSHSQVAATLAGDDQQPQWSRFDGGLNRQPAKQSRRLSSDALAYEPVATRSDLLARQVVPDRPPEGSDVRLVRSKLERLIDTTENITELRNLRSAMTGPLAERAQERINRLTQAAIESAIPSIITRGEDPAAINATPNGRARREQTDRRAALTEASRIENSGDTHNHGPVRSHPIKPDQNATRAHVEMTTIGSPASVAFKKADRVRDVLAYDWEIDTGPTPQPATTAPIVSDNLERQGRDDERVSGPTDLANPAKRPAPSQSAGVQKHREHVHARCTGYATPRMTDARSERLWRACVLAAFRHASAHHREKDRRSASRRMKFPEG